MAGSVDAKAATAVSDDMKAVSSQGAMAVSVSATAVSASGATADSVDLKDASSSPADSVDHVGRGVNDRLCRLEGRVVRGVDGHLC